MLEREVAIVLHFPFRGCAAVEDEFVCTAGRRGGARRSTIWLWASRSSRAAMEGTRLRWPVGGVG